MTALRRARRALRKAQRELEPRPVDDCPMCDGAGVVERRVAYSDKVDDPCPVCCASISHPALGDLWAVLDSMVTTVELWEESDDVPKTKD